MISLFLLYYYFQKTTINLNLIKLLNYRKLLFFIFFLLFFNILFSQKRNDKDNLSIRPPIYFETHIVPNDSLYTCFISFKIPYNHLLFVRENGSFKSELSITYEIFKNKKFISRIFDKKTISISKYERTNDTKSFVEGITSFNISEGEYRILPSILLGNTDIDLKGMPVKLLVDSTQVDRPLVVYNASSCDSSYIKLANFQNSIPFSKNEYDLLIPIYSQNDISLNVEIKQDEKLIFDEKITEYELLNNKLSECDNQIIITQTKNAEFVKYYRLKFVNKNLIEGNAKVLIKSDSIDYDYDFNVFWNEKPKSLIDVEEAIEAMVVIGLREESDSLLDFSDDEQYKALFDYWSRFDDDKSTSFNEVFDEFYARIDFVKEEYNSLGKNDGLETDRGKTYLLFGEPNKIERTYSEVYNVLEVWIYNSLNEKIYFSDKTGTGKFERIK